MFNNLCMSGSLKNVGGRGAKCLKILSIYIICTFHPNFTTVSTRSLGMVTPNWMTTDFIIKEPVLGGASIAAVNEQGRDHRGIA